MKSCVQSFWINMITNWNRKVFTCEVVNAKYSAGKVSCIEHQKLSFGTNAKRNFFDIKVDYIDMILVRNNLWSSSRSCIDWGFSRACVFYEASSSDMIYAWQLSRWDVTLLLLSWVIVSLCQKLVDK